MSTEVAGASRSTVLDRIKALQEQGAPITQPRSRGMQFIRFDGNTGAVTYGRDQTDLPDTQEFVCAAENFFHGCTYWQSSRPNNETRKRAKVLTTPNCPMPPEGEPMQGDLPKPRDRDGWAMEMGMILSGIGGELDKIEMEFGTSSQGQKDAIRDLWGEIMVQASTPEGERNFLNPVITFGVSSYFNKSYKRDIYTPDFTIIGWTDDAGNRIDVGGAPLLTSDDPDPFAE